MLGKIDPFFHLENTPQEQIRSSGAYHNTRSIGQLLDVIDPPKSLVLKFPRRHVLPCVLVIRLIASILRILSKEIPGYVDRGSCEGRSLRPNGEWSLRASRYGDAAEGALEPGDDGPPLTAATPKPCLWRFHILRPLDLPIPPGSNRDRLNMLLVSARTQSLLVVSEKDDDLQTHLYSP